MSAQIKLNKAARTSFSQSDAASRLKIGVRACEQIQEFGFTLLKKDGLETFRMHSYTQVARSLGLNPETLRRHQTHMRGKHLMKTDNIVGPRCQLGKALESEIIRYLVWMDDRGFPLAWHKVGMVARELSMAHGVNDFVASPGWVEKFKRR